MNRDFEDFPRGRDFLLRQGYGGRVASSTAGNAEGTRVSQTCRKRFPGNDLFAVAKRGQKAELRMKKGGGATECRSAARGNNREIVTIMGLALSPDQIGGIGITADGSRGEVSPFFN